MDETPRITVDQLNQRMEAGEDVVVVDVRRGSYEQSDVKIKGAVRIDPEAYEREYTKLPDGAKVVTYCT
jgi:rhodanese-related sulfurtransferase